MFDFFNKGNKEDDSSFKNDDNTKSTQQQQDDADFSDDPVDKIFSFFFGQKEEAPMGMKRFGRGQSCLSNNNISFDGVILLYYWKSPQQNTDSYFHVFFFLLIMCDGCRKVSGTISGDC
jgi:hypothetical protein